MPQKIRIIATHRKAKRDYLIFDTYQAGIELKGMEVKSLRTRGCSIDESFARLENQEVFLYNMHIPEFEKSAYFRPNPRRPRKLLLHKKEIKKFFGLVAQRGLTLIPLKIFFNERGTVKVDIAVARGRKFFDKRKKLKDEIAQKEAQRELKKYKRT